MLYNEYSLLTRRSTVWTAGVRRSVCPSVCLSVCLLEMALRSRQAPHKLFREEGVHLVTLCSLLVFPTLRPSLYSVLRKTAKKSFVHRRKFTSILHILIIVHCKYFRVQHYTIRKEPTFSAFVCFTCFSKQYSPTKCVDFVLTGGPTKRLIPIYWKWSETYANFLIVQLS